MFQIIPVLEVCEACHWCDGQECFAASVWWGDCLLSFYTKDSARLDQERLNQTACNVLIELTKAIRPDQETVIDPGDMWKAIGNAGCLCCFWEDWQPPMAIAISSKVSIPLGA